MQLPVQVRSLCSLSPTHWPPLTSPVLMKSSETRPEQLEPSPLHLHYTHRWHLLTQWVPVAYTSSMPLAAQMCVLMEL